MATTISTGDLYFETCSTTPPGFSKRALAQQCSGGKPGPWYRWPLRNDLNAVQTGLMADVAAGTLAARSSPTSTKCWRTSQPRLRTCRARQQRRSAQAALRTAHLDIINTIENDATLQALSIKDDNPGFNFAPPALATPLHATPHQTFAELGAIFDDAQSRSLGGINADNLPRIQADLQVVHDG